MKILLLDNYDSFTYNIVHVIKKLGYTDIDVIRNDKITLEEVAKYDKIILSPGPGIPSEAGIMEDLIRRYGQEKSILGVCLGHQAIGEVYGAKLENLSNVYHGIATKIKVIAKDKIYENLPEEFEVGRYHSWVVKNENLPEDIIVTSIDDDNNIMGLRHKSYDVYGVQFHPESILTPLGEELLNNFLSK